jgi:hypothetical protein
MSTNEIKPRDIVKVDGKKACVVELIYDESVGVTGAVVGILTDGESDIVEVGLHRITPA